MSTGTSTKERPILMAGPMALAAHNGTKTQTRRPVKGLSPSWEPAKLPEYARPGEFCFYDPANPVGTYPTLVKSPFGITGERLWVRETWRESGNAMRADGAIPKDRPAAGSAIYAADDKSDGPWRPSIHMPRWASRTTLEIVNVRVERVKAIMFNDAGAIAEGATERDGLWSMDWSRVGQPSRFAWDGKTLAVRDVGLKYPWCAFGNLWDSLYAESFPWASNPWVWVYEFKKVTA